jgi:hypothetical protein
VKTAEIHPGIEAAIRPTGWVEPEQDRARLALVALRDGRIEDAAHHAQGVPVATSTGRSWKSLLSGLVTIARGELRYAEAQLLEASTLACVNALNADQSSQMDAWRLAGRTLHHLGWVYRRQDRLAEASHTHLAAHRLRDKWGSPEEIGETAIELGLDYDLARNYQEGCRWHRIALQAAKQAVLDRDRMQAVAWSYLAASCTDDGRHDEGVSAARSARDSWRAHDIGAVTAAQADVKLGAALLKQGEVLCDQVDERAGAVLTEAITWFTAGRDALLAFGGEHTEAARRCDEQIDFARRLLATLEE